MVEVLNELKNCESNDKLNSNTEKKSEANYRHIRRTKWEHAATVLLSAAVSAAAAVIITLNYQDPKDPPSPVLTPEPAKTVTVVPIDPNPTPAPVQSDPDLNIKEEQIANLINDFQQSQSALNELC
ncbi:MAG: hypothetical protein GY893_13395, partial [bacterium]|nr:hypothetical protein [bacterium]